VSGQQEHSDLPGPVLFLDVDGVLNAISSKPDRQVWPDWQQADVTNRIGTFPIAWSPSVTRRIASWIERRLVTVVWLTTWLDDASGALRETIGLPACAVLGSHLADDPGLPSGSVGLGWWKADLVEEYLAANPGAPFVWLEDDLQVMRPLQARLNAEHDCLLIAPPSHIGLTPKHLQRVEDWMLRHQPVPRPETAS